MTERVAELATRMSSGLSICCQRGGKSPSDREAAFASRARPTTGVTTSKTKRGQIRSYYQARGAIALPGERNAKIASNNKCLSVGATIGQFAVVRLRDFGLRRVPGQESIKRSPWSFDPPSGVGVLR
jgi:hypothetical protein